MKTRTAHVLLLAISAWAAPYGHAVAQDESIVAIVNGDVISQTDVANRARLFALSSGMGISPDVVARLQPQIARQLIDEKLRLQEIQRRHIVVHDQDIAGAIKEIETRNGMQTGDLQHRLGAQGIAYRSLIDQIRVQIGWTRVLRQDLGERAQISDVDVESQEKLEKAKTGQPEYRLSDIFIPIDNPSAQADASRFADTVIGPLRAGASFSVAAAQFSQLQNALQGGDEGWVHPDTLDPAVAAIVTQMPPGAISNPIPVPGGIMIVALRAKREVGRDMATMLALRQIFLPFTAPLDPTNPTEQQKQQLNKAHELQHSLHDCPGVEAANQAAGGTRPADPGEVRLEQVTPPPFKAALTNLQPGQMTQPLIAPDGIGLVMMCSRTTRNVAEVSGEEIRQRLLSQRIDLASRQLLRDLHRRAMIDERTPVAR